MRFNAKPLAHYILKVTLLLGSYNYVVLMSAIIEKLLSLEAKTVKRVTLL